ncbi:hypothetical protein N1851_005935 [Merluccius polli]|uniref:Sushi domain-containing protein n=1 Tax=Merluccius polli TaxID=89951 RepID=A0AA47N6D5_MERPO|nr:hypothetical protein N1851_005935 [Merluccius polli]
MNILFWFGLTLCALFSALDVHCDLPERVENAVIMEMNQEELYSSGTIVTYVCRINYIMKGESRIECRNGVWKPKSPTCTSDGAELKKVVPAVEPEEVVPAVEPEEVEPAVEPSRRVPFCLKLQINTLNNIYPCPVSEGPERKPLRWRVAGRYPTTLAPNVGLLRPGRDTEGLSKLHWSHQPRRGQPPQHQLPLNGSDGQRRSGEAAQRPPPATPGAAQASRPSARGPGAQGPMLQEEMGGGSCLVALVEGGDYELFQALRELPPRPSCRASSKPIQPAPAASYPQRHLRQPEQQPQASGLRDGGGGWGGRVTLGRLIGLWLGGAAHLWCMSNHGTQDKPAINTHTLEEEHSHDLKYHQLGVYHSA